MASIDDRQLQTLQPFAPSVTQSARGRAAVTLVVAADGLAEAVETAVEVAVGLYRAPAIACEVHTTEEFSTHRD